MKNSCFYKERQRQLDYLCDAILVGKYKFPLLQPTKAIPRNVCSFTERKKVKEAKYSWVDFFVDDSHFITMKKIEYISIFENLEKLKKNSTIKKFLHVLEYNKLYNVYIRLKKIIKSLRHFEGVITPDFSLYPEMEIIDRILNARLSRITAYYMQRSGINIIPSISWAVMEFRNIVL